MTQDEIIRMAREAGLNIPDRRNDLWMPQLERFAALVAAHERNRHAWTQEHWTEYEHAIAAAEREACAKVADNELMNTNMLTSYPPKSSAAWNIAAAIRARGEK